MNYTTCVVQYTSPDICSNYASFSNTCGAQATCKYTLSNGQTGCVFPVSGKNDCLFYNSTGLPGTIVCVPAGNIACEIAIGCG